MNILEKVKNYKKGCETMSFNFVEELGKSIQKTIEKQNERKNINVSEVEGIENEEVELAQKLDAVEEYTIDRFEENMAVLEDRKTGKMKNIEKEKIPENTKEGDIIKCINGKYFLDKEMTEKVENEIEEKYKNLWK